MLPYFFGCTAEYRLHTASIRIAAPSTAIVTQSAIESQLCRGSRQNPALAWDWEGGAAHSRRQQRLSASRWSWCEPNSVPPPSLGHCAGAAALAQLDMCCRFTCYNMFRWMSTSLRRKKHPRECVLRQCELMSGSCCRRRLPTWFDLAALAHVQWHAEQRGNIGGSRHGWWPVCG